ncbi:MAG: sigma-54 dependent transcriptional regulator [Candidatus Cloacimonadaceae bacterium]|jgi:DNA-binding NtrC family response regulator|nr:sigma-54 dependent transcriptional regulator [Candidatus Cloacimonadota bacterium]MCB5255166.1 sigma-54 dependent transcriptional regulator [Candidatus Cloacimonadota bacterium]MCK9177639.1 sigma-54 dependent transcriptional regulator [Candidatus Cloacimonadota bacterium]MCK9242261.1 sigma-54 dependent transcriptional regulator [Candidatus Cloacimonadota bacterium]MDY0127156.1 sigma-54 dependent transcriptional regulator [Candidatus Cloacimonadaceae bacterium]
MSEKQNILIVDDSQDSLDLIGSQLEDDYNVTAVTSVHAAMQKLESHRYHIAIVDLVLPGENGLDLISDISTKFTYTAVIAVSGQASIETAVQAMKLGASEFIEKPIRNLDLINILVEKTLQAQWLIAENERLNAMIHKEIETNLVIGNSPAIQVLIQKLKKIAALDTLALITGETGVGKTVFAELIHRNSLRRHKKFVTVNCGSLTETLLESLLFGHKKGAFTDAHRDKIGYFQEANGGTLFLDEIAETSLAFQVKLLKVLDSGVFRAVGSDSDLMSDTRIIAATNKDIKALVKDGSFREDLYYRLNVINLHIPPLRERRDDIRILASSFVQEFCRKYKKDELKISPGVMSMILHHEWKGNIRELRNALEHAVILAENMVIQPEDLPENIAGVPAEDQILPELDKTSWAFAKETFSKHYVHSLLLKTGGNIMRAAAIAEITRENFYKKCTTLGIDWRQYRKAGEYKNGGE